MAINPRWLRKGRIAYTDESRFAILIASPNPGHWLSINSDGVVQVTTSRSIVTKYDRLFATLNSVKCTPATKSIFENIFEVLGRTGSYPVFAADIKVQQNRVYKALTMAAPGSMPSVSSSMLMGTSPMPEGAIKEALSLAREAKPDAARASSKFEVRPYDPTSFWYESEEDASLYRAYIELRRNHHPVNLLIAGPSGSGKTEGILRLGQELGMPVHIINCQAITTPEKWIGQMHADIETGTRFIPSQHIEWVERTHSDCEGFDSCILLYDEITRLRPELNNMTYSLFDTQRGLEVPQMGRRVTMAQENMIVATANIGSAFTGTHTQDRAFRERFAITMERNFPPPTQEVKVLTSSTGLDEDHSRELVKVANSTRTMWNNDEVESPISTRTLKAWALLVSGGYSVKKAAEYTVIPLYSNDGGLASDRTKVASLIEGKVR